MKILVINSGSSSLKYQLIDMTDESVISKGTCERVGFEDSFISYKTFKGIKKTIKISMENHIEAFKVVKDILLSRECGVISSVEDVTAIGHRVVLGGPKFDKSVIINKDVIKSIEEFIPLAPLHNTANIQGILACKDIFGKNIPQVAVFDTSFHSTMLPKAYIFPIPYEYYEKYNIRKYGFHGTSHRYVSSRCAELMNKDISKIKMITCHLGNGSSIAAIDGGKVIDTSMGLTPLDGLIMGTRSGSIDPSVVTFIMDKENLSPREMNKILNKKSGFLGVSKISSDDRDISNAAAQGNAQAMLAHDILRYQMTKLIGGYIAALNGCDSIVFTAGIGSNEPSHRYKVCESLSYLGLKIDEKLNNQMIRGKEGKISTNDSKIDVFVIPTNEELLIARDTKNLIEQKKCSS